MNDTTSLFESIAVTQVSLACLTSAIAVSAFIFQRNGGFMYVLLAEFMFVLVPISSVATFASDYIYVVYIVLLSMVIVHYTMVIMNDNFVPVHSNNNKSSKSMQHKHLPFITYFRSIINIFTCVCILAVDLPVFPARFAKSKTYGYGLMDTGVGLFVMSHSLTYKIHSGEIKKQLKSSLVLFLLGVVRFILLLCVNKEPDVTEYGTHWNFFITLGVIKMINVVFLPRINVKYSWIYAVEILFMHQILLSLGVEQWIISDYPRDTFVSANREGLISIVGYECLFLFGITIKSYLYSNNNGRSLVVILSKLILGAIVFTCFTKICEIYFGVSRRTVNCGYVLWILCLCLFSLTTTVATQLYCDIIKAASNRHLLIIQSINYNPLTFFLTCNILTGFINIYVNFAGISYLNSIVILFSYLLVNCSVSYVMYCFKIRLF